MAKNKAALGNNSTTDLFKQKLQHYKQFIDTDIAQYSSALESQVSEQFGEHSRLAVNAFTDVLGRGGKRIRGGLTMLAYEMFGGKDPEVARVAARAIEMVQAYLLITDDIADRSPVRRGSPSAHIMLKNWHEQHHLKDDAQHFGESIAMNAGLYASHAATVLITDMSIAPEIKARALKTLNQNLLITAHGQFNDIFNEVTESDDVSSIENVLVWKTAYYTFVSPLQFGAELAGVTNGKLETLANYGLHAGRAFQISDDILGTFSDQQESGKSPHDDMREGKRTLMIAYALKKASTADAHFLRQCLGNQALTSAEFDRCKDIIKACGALEYAHNEVIASADKAIAVLDIQAKDWDTEGVEFLRQLVQYLVIRKA
jgi:geranylgeranyl diphosphate synthase type I